MKKQRTAQVHQLRRAAVSADERPQKRIRIDDLITITPLTENQFKVRNEYRKDKNLVLQGCPGTGKTFLAMAYGFEQVLDKSENYRKLVIVRSIVPSRNIGFLKGDEKDKVEVYKAPYKDIADELFETSGAYDALEAQGIVQFEPTSFIRGRNINDSIIIVDECQNLTFHELDSIITRVGTNTKIIFCGDYNQTDLTKTEEKIGLLKFLKILKSMGAFGVIEFQPDDIVRSELVKSYILAKLELGYQDG